VSHLFFSHCCFDNYERLYRMLRVEEEVVTNRRTTIMIDVRFCIIGGNMLFLSIVFIEVVWSPTFLKLLSV
jgi:hypothetical protein